MSSNENGYRKADELISALFEGISSSEMQESLKLTKGWKSIVSSIKTNQEKDRTGALLSAHTKIIDFKNEILLVEADHPAYIQMLHIYKNYILTGLQRQFPQLNIKNLSFRLKGSTAKLHNVENNQPREIVEEHPAKMEIDENLPDPLKASFEALRNSLLTKDTKK